MMSTSVLRKPSARSAAEPPAQPPNLPRRRVAPKPTDTKPPLRPRSTATRSLAEPKNQPKCTVKSAVTRQPNAPSRPRPPLPHKTTTVAAAVKRKSSVKPTGSLVHDAVRRAFHASHSVEHVDTELPVGPLPHDYAAECERLREELERVMADHQRQADEIVALRALAKSMKEEVEVMQDAVSREQDTADSWRRQPNGSLSRRADNHEFFQLDAQIDELRIENGHLKSHLEVAEREKRELQDLLENELPRFELLAVQARAELESVESQLLEEQTENDRLRTEVAYYKARSRSPVRTQRSRNDYGRNGSGGTQTILEEHDEETDKENRQRGNGFASSNVHDDALRASFMSSVASLSMSAVSVVSTQLQDDLETLKDELRQLHRTIDASVVKEDARASMRSSGGGRGMHRQRASREEHKSED